MKNVFLFLILSLTQLQVRAEEWGEYLAGSNPDTALILCHARAGSPNWHIVKQIRVALNEHLGLHTYSLNLPHSNNTHWTEYYKHFPQAHSVIENALKWLDSKHIKKYYFFGDGMGARTCSSYIREHKNSKILGLITTRARNSGEFGLNVKENFAAMDIDILDIYSADEKKDLQHALKRQNITSSKYKQVQVSGSGMHFTENIDELISVIASWLSDKTNIQASVKPRNATDTISTGTAWPIDKNFVITSHHVVANKQQITLTRIDGIQLRAKVAVADQINDIAVLSVLQTEKLPPPLELSEQLSYLGAKVFTIGYPLPNIMGFKPKYASGDVSSLFGIGDDPRLYQVTVPIQLGNSGGPLVDMNGKVVAMIQAKLNADTIYQQTGTRLENVNYAIKIAYIKTLLDALPVSGRAQTAQNKLTLSRAKESNPRLAPIKQSVEKMTQRIQNSIMQVIAQ